MLALLVAFAVFGRRKWGATRMGSLIWRVKVTVVIFTLTITSKSTAKDLCHCLV